jgi:hypothetical protein
MEIYINECSFHEQFFNRMALERAFRVFFSILNTTKDIQNEYRFYNNEDLIHIYKAFNEEVLISSINHLHDKSFSRAIIDVLYNRLNPKDWRNEQVHLSEDIFVYKDELITDTSMAELAERSLQNINILATLINFPSSKFTDQVQICITKNDVDTCDLNCVETKEQMQNWLNNVLNLQDIHYESFSVEPPRDRQTILRDIVRFEKTNLLQGGRRVYKESKTQYYWYVDNFHFGQAAHIEVFDAHGLHVGEASLEGVIDVAKRDLNKRIDP